MPTLLNFGKEKDKLENLEGENVKLLGQMANYQKELILYHARSSADKQSIATQTTEPSNDTQANER